MYIREDNVRMTVRRGQAGGPSMTRRVIRRLDRGLAWLILVGLGVEVYLVGTRLFGATNLQPHRILGDALTLPILLLPILAFLGQRGRRIIRLSALLVALTVLQVLLPSLRSSLPWVAALHAVNALALLGVTAVITLSADAKPTSIEMGDAGESLEEQVVSTNRKVAAS